MRLRYNLVSEAGVFCPVGQGIRPLQRSIMESVSGGFTAQLALCNDVLD